MTDIEMAYTAGGCEVPKTCVMALDGLEMRWPGASFPGARTALAVAVVDALPYEIQTRVRYVLRRPWHGFDDKTVFDWSYRNDDPGDTPESAAANPWLMNNCIVWVEERKVYATDWEPIGEDCYTDG